MRCSNPFFSKFLVFFLCFFSTYSVKAELYDYIYPNQQPSFSNYGTIGLLSNPSARFLDEGSLGFAWNHMQPYLRGSLVAYPFNWFEATYRYNEIKNQQYGPSSYSGNQTLKDKGFDLKFGLLGESFYAPAIAMGIRDLAGTGLFSSEYIVASKKINNFDVSLGLGWGVLGTQGGISSPLKFVSDGFEIRDAESGQGGEFSYSNWFSGTASILSAIEYDLKKTGLRLKLEYDTTNPDQRNIVQEVKSRFNFGFTYHLSENFKFSSSFERGDQFRIGFNLKGNFLKDTISKPKPKNVVKLNEIQQERIRSDKNVFYRSLFQNKKIHKYLSKRKKLKNNNVFLWFYTFLHFFNHFQCP